jgi:hypothetical protein
MYGIADVGNVDLWIDFWYPLQLKIPIGLLYIPPTPYHMVSMLKWHGL